MSSLTTNSMSDIDWEFCPDQYQRHEQNVTVHSCHPNESLIPPITIVILEKPQKNRMTSQKPKEHKKFQLGFLSYSCLQKTNT